jgi:hypothetical protein
VEIKIAKSTKLFNRWAAHDETTWCYQIYLQYDDQLGRINTAHTNAMMYTYANIGKQDVKWEDGAAHVLETGDKFLDSFTDLRHWSDSYNQFDNWVNLNVVLTSAANLETYLASVVDLAIKSNPGVLFRSPRAIDGGFLLKRGTANVDTESSVTACTKNYWSARLAALRRLFGDLPDIITKHHGDLEELRVVRNRVGHAFGRDIDAARDHGARAFHPMETMKREHAHRLGRICQTVARELDRHLLSNYIGDFEIIRFLALHHEDVSNLPLGERAKALKTAVGRIGAQPRGKLYCRGLIEYWDAL